MKKFSIKYQLFQSLCMSNMQFDSPSELHEALVLVYNFITEDVDLDEDIDTDNVVHLVN